MAHHDSSEQVAHRVEQGRWLVALALALGLALTALLLGSIAKAVLFASSLALFVGPGIVLARRWYPSSEAVLVGSALGYLLGSLAASALVRFEILTPEAVVVSSLALLALAWGTRRFLPEGPGRPDEPREGRWLGATLVFALLLVAIPFSKVGARVPEGVAFRAYFSADLMTHLSVVAELQKDTYPLENPFYSGDRLGYYWLFFAFPAALGRSTSNQGALLSLYLASGFLFAGLFFVAGRALGLSPPRAFLATAVVLGASGYDGVLALARAALGGPSFLETNVDAFGRWALGLVSLDGLHRSVLYTPQHLFSYSLLLVLLVLVLRGEPRGISGALFCGLLLGGMAGTSIVTAMLAGPWLVLVVLWRRPSIARFASVSLSLAAPSLALLALYVALGFFGDAGGALVLRAPRWAELPAVMFFDCGALLLLLLLRKRFEKSDVEVAALAAVALAAVLFLDVEGYEGVWMAWRAGSVLLVALGLLAAPAFTRPLGWRHALVLVPATLTAGLDLFNAQDVSNRSVSAGEFRWTTVVSEDEWEALHWLRAETPTEAVVQWDVRVRELGEWALIPALAERRMAVGSPIFLLDRGKYRARERRQVRPIFTSSDSARAYRLARELGIDYLFIGPSELRARGDGIRALFESPSRFRQVFSRGAVTILEVVRD